MDIKTIDHETGEEFLCQFCDEAFFHLGEKEPVCPKCGASGSVWLMPMPLQEDEDEQGSETGAAGGKL